MTTNIHLLQLKIQGQLHKRGSRFIRKHKQTKKQNKKKKKTLLFSNITFAILTFFSHRNNSIKLQFGVYFY